MEIAAPVYLSPWAAVADQDWSIDAADAAETVKKAYTVLKAMGRVEFEWEHEAGLMVWFRRVNGDMATGVDEGLLCMKPVVGMTFVAGYGQVCWRDQVAPAKRVKAGKANALRVRAAMEVFREGEGDEARFFVVWEDMRAVKINGRVCVPEDDGTVGYAAGPLPEFAIVEVEDTVVFWFRDIKAMDFVTKEIEKRKLDRELLGDLAEDFEVIDEGDDEGDDDAEEDDEEDEGDDEEKTKENFRAWRRIWQEGVNTHTAAYSEDANVHSPTFLKSSSDLHGETIIVAIASVWATADKRLGRRFAIHDYNHYSVVRSDMLDALGYRNRIPAAVYGPNDLLVPLVFVSDYMSPPNSAKQHQTLNSTSEEMQEMGTNKDEKDANEHISKDGHILFAVAEKKENNRVNAKIMDSCPGFISKERSLAAVKKTAKRIGWLGMDKAGQAIELDYEIELIERSIVDVPFQEGINTCGIYAILNAWMVMLRLPALNKQQRVEHEEPMLGNEFVDSALEIINLAMAGYMDLQTIQAFFNYSGYCQLQDPNDAQVRFQRGHLTHRMNDKRLTELLEGARAIGQAESEHEVDHRRFPQVLIDLVKERTKCSHSEAMRLLEFTEGSVDNAVSLYLAETTE